MLFLFDNCFKIELPRIPKPPVIKIFNDGNDMSQGYPATTDQPQYQAVSEMPPIETPEITNTETTSDVVDFSKPIIIKKD